MKVQMFFATRAIARAAKFGKMTDNGQNSEKRWARTITVSPTNKKAQTLRSSNRRSNKTVTVFYKGKIS